MSGKRHTYYLDDDEALIVDTIRKKRCTYNPNDAVPEYGLTIPYAGQDEAKIWIVSEDMYRRLLPHVGGLDPGDAEILAMMFEHGSKSVRKNKTQGALFMLKTLTGHTMATAKPPIDSDTGKPVVTKFDFDRYDIIKLSDSSIPLHSGVTKACKHVVKYHREAEPDYDGY